MEISALIIISKDNNELTMTEFFSSFWSSFHSIHEGTPVRQMDYYSRFHLKINIRVNLKLLLTINSTID